MSKPLKKAYIAGPLFDEGERWWIESVERLVADAGFETFLPHRDNPPKDQFNVRTMSAISLSPASTESSPTTARRGNLGTPTPVASI